MTMEMAEAVAEYFGISVAAAMDIDPMDITDEDWDYIEAIQNDEIEYRVIA